MTVQFYSVLSPTGSSEVGGGGTDLAEILFQSFSAGGYRERLWLDSNSKQIRPYKSLVPLTERPVSRVQQGTNRQIRLFFSVSPSPPHPLHFPRDCVLLSTGAKLSQPKPGYHHVSAHKVERVN